MSQMLLRVCILLVLMLSLMNSLAPTDTVRDAGMLQLVYLDINNMQLSTGGSAIFGVLRNN
ncbi:hypothetical protein EAF00_005062 [Botryotinia globosa]|nr:hypothetical protein EAF00_005062 [Botryotinia globosa]